MPGFKVEKSDKKKILTIDGAVTIENVDKLKHVLQELVDSADTVVLDVKNVTEADLSCVQLLCSAHKTSIELKKSLALSGNCSEAFRKAVRDSGYAQHKGCKVDTNESCLWLKKENIE